MSSSSAPPQLLFFFFFAATTAITSTTTNTTTTTTLTTTGLSTVSVASWLKEFLQVFKGQRQKTSKFTFVFSHESHRLR